jgi:hypothetical protein
MRPDLVEGHEEGRDLLGQLDRVDALALVEVLVLERAVEALDHAVGLGNVALTTSGSTLRLWHAPRGPHLAAGGRRGALLLWRVVP